MGGYPGVVLVITRQKDQMIASLKPMKLKKMPMIIVMMANVIVVIFTAKVIISSNDKDLNNNMTIALLGRTIGKLIN